MRDFQGHEFSITEFWNLLKIERLAVVTQEQCIRFGVNYTE